MSKIPVEIKKMDNSQIEIIGEISADIFEAQRAGVIQSFSDTVEIDGFRKGHVPEGMLIQHVGEPALLNEMADRAIKKVYPTLIVENKIDAIGRPEVIITKIAAKNPLGFKITTAVMPDITLPDYKKIAAGITKDAVEPATDSELEHVINEVRGARAQQETQHMDPEKTGERPSAEKTKILDPNGNPIKKEPELPELSDEFVKTLGNFKDVADFKSKVRENITKEKEMKARDKRRMKIAEKIIHESSFSLPEILVEGETEKMLGRVKDDVAHAGLEWNKYLEHVKKTEDEIRKEIRPEAEKRGKLQLLIEEIAQKENIVPDHGEVKKQIDAILTQYKDAREENVRVYVESVLKNEAVFNFLEETKE